jgi:hypothetical protein
MAAEIRVDSPVVGAVAVLVRKAQTELDLAAPAAMV